MTLALRTTEPTQHQLEILARTLRDGRSTCAADMGISERTVQNTLVNLYTKLGASDRVEAAQMLGWLRIPDELFE